MDTAVTLLKVHAFTLRLRVAICYSLQVLFDPDLSRSSCNMFIRVFVICYC